MANRQVDCLASACRQHHVGITGSASFAQRVAVIDPGIDNDAGRGLSPVKQTKAIGADLRPEPVPMRRTERVVLAEFRCKRVAWIRSRTIVIKGREQLDAGIASPIL